jgi:type II secretory pathway pseudopilin PulG
MHPRILAQPGLLRGPNHTGAFSLIELIGVLAVLAIVAAATVPVVIKHIDLAAYNGESASLNGMSTALIQYVLRSNSIPNQTGWVQAISSELTLRSNQIAATPRNWSRAYLIDTNGWLRTALASGAWNQSAGGTVLAPTNARLMIVSALARGLPVSSGMPSAASFQDIWNTPPPGQTQHLGGLGWHGRRPPDPARQPPAALSPDHPRQWCRRAGIFLSQQQHTGGRSARRLGHKQLLSRWLRAGFICHERTWLEFGDQRDYPQ